MAATTTYLITGANRGLGQALVAVYLARSNNTVVAAVRDPTSSSSKALHDLPKGEGSSLIIVKIESASETDAAEAIAGLRSEYNITALDVVIANAGISKVFPIVQDAQTEDMLEHYRVNVIGIVILFRAVVPLLKSSTKNPKFVTMSSGAGSIADMEIINIPNSVYGTSKAALNYITRKIHIENPDIIAFPLDPGWVQTDMGNAGAVLFGMEKAEITVETSVTGLVNVIDNATKEAASGQYLVYDGTIRKW